MSEMKSLKESLSSGRLSRMIAEMEARVAQRRVVPFRPRPTPPPSSPRFIAGFHPSQLVFVEDEESKRTVAQLAEELSSCPACFSSGMEVFQEGAYQYARPCPICGPARKIIERFERMNLSDEWASISEGSTHWRPDLRSLYEGFLANWKPRGPGLFLYGDTGRGKSHLAALMAYAFAFRDIRVEWRRWSLFLEELRESYDDVGFSRDRESDLRKRILFPEVLFIDDLGEGRQTEWSKEIFERVIGQRLERRLTTIFASNVDLHALQGFGGKRAYSRLMRACVPVHVEGEDYRLRGMI